jgi:hypothetical protein
MVEDVEGIVLFAALAFVVVDNLKDHGGNSISADGHDAVLLLLSAGDFCCSEVVARTSVFQVEI